MRARTHTLGIAKEGSKLNRRCDFTMYFLDMEGTRCQIAVAGTTYILNLKVERESHESDCDCDCKKRAWTTHLLEVWGAWCQVAVATIEPGWVQRTSWR
jgi:hypothetical protein